MAGQDATDGTPFGRYRLLALLGGGGMGEVWRAFDTVTERVVALKVLPTQYADDAVFQERFRREAKSAAALDEPHVVPIHDYGEIDGRLFVTMRLIKGRDLNSILSAGPLDPTRAVGIIDQIATALHAAHQVNLVHRDVKPSNILVTDDDFAYLIDFGIARAAGQSGLTSTSTVIGTWAYMAPERFSTGQTDARADIYALACVLFECLTGSKPFGGDSMEQQIGGHLTLPPPRASDRVVGVPAELDAVIAKGMAKNPDDRYATTRELARAAKSALGGAETRPNTMPPTMAGPVMNAGVDPRTQHGYAATGPVWASGPSPTDPTQLRPMWAGPTPPPPKNTSRKGWLIALSSVGAVVAIAAFVAIALVYSGDQGSSRAHSTSPTPSALPNTGPFTGTFTVDMGPEMLANGTLTTGSDAAAFSETWRLRSACSANGCVATALTGGHYPVKDLVFDNVGGRWLAVSTSRGKCVDREDDEEWNVISLQPQADGTMSGESTQTTVSGCEDKRTVTFTRGADADIALLPDPATQPPRVVSPAQSLHGRYDNEVTYANGFKADVDHFSVRTDCLRTGDRCMSLFFHAEGFKLFVFANGVWTRNTEFEAPCPTGGTSHAKTVATLPLPQPLQDPILSLAGHGYAELGPGTQCHSQAFDDDYTRTGD